MKPSFAITHVCQVQNGTKISVGVLHERKIHILNSGNLFSCTELALARGVTLAECLANMEITSRIDCDTSNTWGLTFPIHHLNPAMTFIGGTGLTHMGKDRDAMHGGTDEVITDSRRMQIEGAKSGKSDNPLECWEPELFLKGNGTSLVKPGGKLLIPSWAKDGGEEAELVGIFYINKDGTPTRIGYAIGNEFSDHKAEKRNYLHLAGSKLRTCSVGPVIRLGAAPSRVDGTVSLFHSGQIEAYWSGNFSTGEDVMHYTLANLDWHHFKHLHHRLPGSLHFVYYGTAMLSFTAGIEIQSGDTVRIFANDFILPLENTVHRIAAADDAFEIKNLY